MRVAFFGLPLAALLLHRDGHEIVHAAISRADAVGNRRIRRVLGAARVVRVGEVGAAALRERVKNITLKDKSKFS